MEKKANIQSTQRMKQTIKSWIMCIGDKQKLETGLLRMITLYLSVTLEKIIQTRMEKLKHLLSLPVEFDGIVGSLRYNSWKTTSMAYTARQIPRDLG